MTKPIFPFLMLSTRTLTRRMKVLSVWLRFAPVPVEQLVMPGRHYLKHLRLPRSCQICMIWQQRMWTVVKPMYKFERFSDTEMNKDWHIVISSCAWSNAILRRTFEANTHLIFLITHVRCKAWHSRKSLVSPLTAHTTMLRQDLDSRTPCDVPYSFSAPGQYCTFYSMKWCLDF